MNVVELRVADTAVGELRYRAKAPPAPSIARMVTTLLALELERSRAPEWASEEVAGAFVTDVLSRKVTDRGAIVARGAELGADLDRGAGVLDLRASPRAAQDGGVAGPRPDPCPARPALARARRPGDHRGRRARRRSGGTAGRNETTVASQSLFLLNSPFVREQARALAERLLSDSSLSDAERVERAHRLALGRSPSRRRTIPSRPVP